MLARITLGSPPPAGGTAVPPNTLRWFGHGWMVHATVTGGVVTAKGSALVESNP
jgi:hypothetical protein